jgi:glycosyltransferase involved in cell wall biosynthesis
VKLAFVSPRFPAEGVVGGAETLLRRLAEHCASAGHEVHCFATCARDHHTWRNELPAGERREGALRVRLFPVDESRDVALFLRLQAAVSSGRAVPMEDQRRWLEHSVNSPALIAALGAEAETFDAILTGPYLFGLTWAVTQVAPARTWLVPCLHDEGFARQAIIGDMFRRVRGLLFNSAPEHALARRLYGEPFANGAVVGMGLEDFSVDPAAFPRARGLTAPYLLYSGRREPLKGTPLLIEYTRVFRLRTGRDLRLVLTGSGAVEVPEDFRPAVLDCGFVSEREKHEAMAGALAFAHPSTLESFGIVLLEAWLARTPALVHAAGEVLRHQCAVSGGGLWFRHYPDFETLVLRLLDDPDLRARLGQSGRAYVRREYSWPAVGHRLFTALGPSPTG